MMTTIKKRVFLINMACACAITCAGFAVGTLVRAQQRAPEQYTITEPEPSSGLAAALQNLTPTEGVDISTFASHFLAAVKRTWYAKIPVDAMGDKGKVVIHFRIQKDGTLLDQVTTVEVSSGSDALDNTAIAAIRASTPFEHLPESFKSPNIELRLSFFYNPQLPDAYAGPTTVTVSHVDFEGNRRISSETLQGFIFTRPGDPYLTDALGRDVIALRNTKCFTSVRLEVEDDTSHANAKLVIFHFTEKPASEEPTPSNRSQ
jgi:TonB family protein